MLPRFLVPVLTALILSGAMSFLVSGVATYRSLGMPPGFFGLWISAWLPAWCVAFPTLYLLRPHVMRWVEGLARER